MNTHEKTIVYLTQSLALAACLMASAATSSSMAQDQAGDAITISGSSSGSASSTVSTGTASAGKVSARGEAGFRIESVAEQQDMPIYRILHNDRPIATYHADLEGTPGFYPLLSPSGLPLTRNFPMKPFGEAKSNADAAMQLEKDDHHHHRSMWFNHGEVDEYDFWMDKPGVKTGHIIHRAGHTATHTATQIINGVESSHAVCEIRTLNDWMTPDEKRLLQDERTFRFSEHLGDTVLDCTIRLIAGDNAVTFGDTKEGSLGIRVAGSMKVDAKLGGEIHNAEGLKNDDAWGKASAWVDYSGPIAPPELLSGKKVTAADAADWSHAGITMMYHPTNELPECYWHVRSYGLFAANPFGRKHFGQPAYEGVKIEKGKTLTIHARVILHDGGFDAKKAATHFQDYASKDVSE